LDGQFNDANKKREGGVATVQNIGLAIVGPTAKAAAMAEEASIAAKLAEDAAAKTSQEMWWIQGANKSSLNTMIKGRYAVESVTGNATRDFSAAEREAINRIGQTYGCHTCRMRTPNGVYIPDHQGPLKLNPDGPWELFPHCDGCSRLQGGQVNKVVNY
jgi:hypothetical protein